MAICVPALKQISIVPDDIWNILQVELSNWNYKEQKHSHDAAFISHKVKSYFLGDPVLSTIPNSILLVIEWCRNIVGSEYIAARCFLNLIEPGQEFPIHVDTLSLHLIARRFHIPLNNTDECYYYTYTKNNNQYIPIEHKMQLQMLYELDNIHPHSVINKGTQCRINFIIDMLQTDQLTDNLLKPNIDQLKLFNQLRK